MGVQLFFMVSGFVILGSLEKKRNLRTFARARFRRIFPSLCIAIPTIYFICNMLNQSFIAPIPISSLFPSFTLISPNLLNELFGTNLIWTTGVLWSLFVEIQFYVLVGILYLKNGKSFLMKLVFVGLLMQLIQVLILFYDLNFKHTFELLLPLNRHIWWFIAGCTFFKMYSSKFPRTVLLIMSYSLISNLLPLNISGTHLEINIPLTLMTVSFYIVFFLVVKSPKNLTILRSPALVWLGGISYELYLLHESIGISILSKLNKSETILTNRIMILMALSITILFLFILSYCLKILSRRLQHVFEIKKSD